jgi:hypothetical protein
MIAAHNLLKLPSVATSNELLNQAVTVPSPATNPISEDAKRRELWCPSALTN